MGGGIVSDESVGCGQESETPCNPVVGPTRFILEGGEYKRSVMMISHDRHDDDDDNETASVDDHSADVEMMHQPDPEDINRDAQRKNCPKTSPSDGISEGTHMRTV